MDKIAPTQSSVPSLSPVSIAITRQWHQQDQLSTIERHLPHTSQRVAGPRTAETTPRSLRGKSSRRKVRRCQRESLSKLYQRVRQPWLPRIQAQAQSPDIKRRLSRSHSWHANDTSQNGIKLSPELSNLPADVTSFDLASSQRSLEVSKMMDFSLCPSEVVEGSFLSHFSGFSKLSLGSGTRELGSVLLDFSQSLQLNPRSSEGLPTKAAPSPMPPVTVPGIVTALMGGREETTRKAKQRYLLPAQRVEINQLDLENSADFVGQPGTQLVVKQGPISIRSNSLTPGTVVTFIECSILLEAFNSAAAKVQSLFEIYDDAELVLRDCMVMADDFLHEPSESENVAKIPRIGVHLAAYGQGLRPARIRAMGCSFSGFFMHIMAERATQLEIQNCGFQQSSNACIFSLSPSKLEITESMFEDSKEAGIEIRWLPSQEQLGDVGKLSPREVRIEHNTIEKTQTVGIAILSEIDQEPSAGHPVPRLEIKSICVNSNTISNCKQDGIRVRYLSHYAHIEIKDNQITDCEANGIEIVSTNKPLLPSHVSRVRAFELDKNKILRCGNSGIMLTNSYCDIRNCRCRAGSKRGIVIQQLHRQLDVDNDWELSLTKTSAKDNTETGIALIDCPDCRILLSQCKMKWNAEYGMYASNNQVDNRSPSPQLRRPNEVASPGVVYLQDGLVFANRRGGIFIGRQSLNVDGTFVTSNGVFAIRFDDKMGNVRYSARTLATELIQGTVKNKKSQVNIYPTKASAHSCCVCHIV